MSGEMIAIVAVGVALAGVILTATRGLRQDMARLESRLDERINGLDFRFDAIEKQFGELRERMARHEWCPRLLPFPVRPEPALPAEV